MQIANIANYGYKDMMNFYCLKVGDRYTTEFVYKLNSMIARNYDGEYQLHCITDQPYTVPDGVNIMPIPYMGVHKWWNKMILFNEDYIPEGIFFDLDIIIHNNINNLYNPDQYMRFMHTDWVDLEQLDKDVIGQRQRYCSINSSVLCWDKHTKRHHIWEYFIKNKEKITHIFTGIDSFIEHRFPNDYSLFPNMNDQIHILLDKKQDELRDDEWILKTWI